MRTSDFPLISVLTPAFNHGAYVQETMQSIIDQDYPNIEYIIIDDGSTDNTYDKILQMNEICESVLSKFVCTRKNNEGIVKTLNQALGLANGEYVYIIASDDRAEKTALSTLYDFLAGNPEYGMAVGDNRFIDSESSLCALNKDYEIICESDGAVFETFKSKFISIRNDVDFNSDQFGTYVSLLKGNYIPNGYLIRKKLLDRIGGYSETAVLEDLYLMLQLSKITKFKFIDEPLFYYRKHSTNTVNQKDKMEKITFLTQLGEWSYCKKDVQLRDRALVLYRIKAKQFYRSRDTRKWILSIILKQIAIELRFYLLRAVISDFFVINLFITNLRGLKKRFLKRALDTKLT